MKTTPALGLGPERAKILVVDDLEANIKAMVAVIGGLDLAVDVFCASSGREALGLVIDHDFGLAILDVQMPELDGFELAELMRGRRDSRHIPIIFVTAGAADKHQMFKGYEAGAVDFIAKPFDPMALASKVRVFVELYDARQLLRYQLAEITRQKEEMEVLKVVAEAANDSKSRFLANMSHEIRTPLGAILGFADLLRYADQSSEEREDCIETIRRNGQHLLAIINNVLDISKIEADRLEIELVDMSLAELLADVEGSLRLSASEKGIGLAMTVTGKVPPLIRTDPTRLKQILINIVGNAIKFTGHGTVVVQTSMRAEGPCGESRLVFDVKDSGVGLTAVEATRLFQSFVQSDNSTTRKFGGTGLGLVIARQLARALGGDVAFVDEPGRVGSHFAISINPGPVAIRDYIPIEKVVSAPLTKPDALLLHGLRILLVDDAPDNQVLVNRLLKRVGASVDLAANGKEGVERALEAFYDVVLMDVQMPEMDGIEATALLRRRGFDRPIIALTAHAFDEEGRRCLDAGYSDHLSKPINYQRLVERIQFHARRGSGAAE